MMTSIWIRASFVSARREVPEGIMESKISFRSSVHRNLCVIKVGVGAKPQGWDLADYVLGRFGSEDRKLVDEAQDRACKAVELILSDGPDAAMNESTRNRGLYENIFASSAKSCRDGSNLYKSKK